MHSENSSPPKAEEAIIVTKPKPPPRIDQSKLGPKPNPGQITVPESDKPKTPLRVPERQVSPAPTLPSFSSELASQALAKQHPLIPFSNRGYADELEAEAADTKPLLGEFVMDGQATMIYAPPNTGKTAIILHLLLKAIEEGRIDPNKVFYANLDDGSRGLATKNRLMQDAGAHMVATGRRGLKLMHIVQAMIQAIEDGTALGTLIVIDTIKKLADPMSKKDNREFAQVCRAYVMAGGTVVALGHTRKNRKADGTLEYQGTTDIKEDFDAVYMAEVLTSKAGSTQKLVRFKMDKKRADSPDEIGYTYADQPGMTYEEKLASITPVHPDELDGYRAETEKYSHIAVMEELKRMIEAGEGQGKMALAKKAAKTCGVSQRAAISVLEDHTGTTDITHLWIARTGERGVQVYEMRPKP